MNEVTEAEFEAMVAAAIDGIPEHYARHMNNVGFVIEDEPTAEQRSRLHLVGGQTLYGLYEGVPLTKRNNNYSGVLPDKITIFKLPMLAQAYDQNHLKEIVKNTIWHEVAHHFGLGHGRIHKLEGRSKQEEG